MSHGKPSRKPRWLTNVNTLQLVTRRVALLTDTELAVTLEPLQTAFKALREGVATQWQWQLLASAINCAQAIDKQGVVKGLHQHLHAAEMALQAIGQRAMASGQWQPAALYFQEIDDLRDAIGFHKFQLQQLSLGEVHKAVNYAESEVRSSGGRVMQQRDLLAA